MRQTEIVRQDDARQRAVELKTTIIFDEAQFPELVHEAADARPGRADHFGPTLARNSFASNMPVLFAMRSLGRSAVSLAGLLQRPSKLAVVSYFDQIAVPEKRILDRKDRPSDQRLKP